MAWWLEGAFPGILGGFETRQKQFFCIFLESGKNSKKKKFQEKSVFIGKNRFFSGKNRFFSEKIGFYRKNRRFFADFFFFQFFHCSFFSRPADIRFFSEKSANFGDFLFPDNITVNLEITTSSTKQ